MSLEKGEGVDKESSKKDAEGRASKSKKCLVLFSKMYFFLLLNLYSFLVSHEALILL